MPTAPSKASSSIFFSFLGGKDSRGGGQEEARACTQKKIDSAEVSLFVSWSKICTATSPHFPDHGKPSVETAAHSDEMLAETRQVDVHCSWQ